MIPSKIFEIAAMARPILISVDGEARTIVETLGGGEFVPPEDIDAMCDAIVRFAADPEQGTRMGRSARTRVTREFDREASARRYMDICRRWSRWDERGISAPAGRIILSLAQRETPSTRTEGASRTRASTQGTSRRSIVLPFPLLPLIGSSFRAKGSYRCGRKPAVLDGPLQGVFVEAVVCTRSIELYDDRRADLWVRERRGCAREYLGLEALDVNFDQRWRTSLG